MGKEKRYGFIFTWWIGDHLPLHIHVYKHGKLICRWKILEDEELSGKAPKKAKQALRELKEEGMFRQLEKKNENKEISN